MSPATLARPYARAAFAYARDQGETAKWEAWLGELAEALALPEFKRALGAVSVIGVKPVQQLLDGLAGSRWNKAFTAFAGQLLHARRLKLAGAVLELFQRMQDEHLQRARVLIQTARELDGKEFENMKAALGKRLGCDIIAERETAPSLLGGARIQVGDDVIDNSLSHSLSRMADSLRNP